MSGGSNMVRLGEAAARDAIAAAVRQACAVANISPAQVTRTCMGAAGAARPEIAAVVRRILAELVSGEIEVVGDMVIAHEAVFGGGPGLIVIAGTGSIAYGRNAQGQTARAGGWGSAISDEGSGHWIGRAAVGAAMREYDQTEVAGLLLRGIWKSWGVATREQVAIAANASPSPDFAALLPMVLSAADVDDESARGILTEAGKELAGLAQVVVRRIFDSADVPVATAGGVFLNSPRVRDVFFSALRVSCPRISAHITTTDPVSGALALARNHSQQLR